MFGDKVFCVGQCNAPYLGFFVTAAINYFWKIRMVLKRIFKLFTAVVLNGSGSTATVVCCRLTAEEAEAGLVAQMLELHLSFAKVSAVVVAGADDLLCFFCPALNAAKKLYSLVS